MRYFTHLIPLFFISFLIGCQGELLPFNLDEPLILEQTPNFDSQKLNPLCEINYFEESLYSLSTNGGNLQSNAIYKSMEEWNVTQTNIHFIFNKELNKCNLIFQNLYLDINLPIQRKKDEFGVIRIDGQIQNPLSPKYPSRIEIITKNSSNVYLPDGFSFYDFNNKENKRILMYRVGRYLGLPDSKDRNSYMYPYLVKDGTEGKITEEDLQNLKRLHPTECGKGTIEVNSISTNNNSIDISVKYTNINPKIKLFGCGIIIGEDSSDLTLEKNRFYIFRSSNADKSIFTDRIENLNAQTKYFIKAFSVDVNGINLSSKIVSVSTPNREHDKWIPIILNQEVPKNSFTSFEYKGKIYLGVNFTSNNDGSLFYVDLKTMQSSSIKIDRFVSGESVFLNGYLYINQINNAPQKNKFIRLSLETFLFEELAIPEKINYFSIALFQDGENIYATNGSFGSNYNEYSKYDIKNDSWETIKFTSSNGEELYHRRILPTKKDNQLYFMNNTDGRTIVFDINKKSWNYYNKNFSFLESLLPENLVSISSFSNSQRYNLTTITFQNQIVKLIYDTSLGRYLVNGSSTSNVLLTQFAPNIFKSLESNLYKFDRQALLSFDLTNNSSKALNPLPEQIRRNLINFPYTSNDNNFFMLSDANNIYAGYGLNSKIKTIWKYIP